jgi:hypothetical protein
MRSKKPGLLLLHSTFAHLQIDPAMKNHTILLVFVWCCCGSWVCQAQGLFQAPFVSYLGRGLEDHKLTLFSALPYDGIGKKCLMEHYPQLWSQTFTRYTLPSSSFLDAFGAVGPNFPITDFSDKAFQTALIIDQFGNIEANFYNNYRPHNFQLLNLVNHQTRTRSDWNNNQLLDYAPGNQLTSYNALSFHSNRFSTGVNSYFLDNKEWGGATQIDPQQPEIPRFVDGFIRDAQHWQVNLWASYSSHNFGNLGLSLDLNHHKQNLGWKSYQYQGLENQQSFLLTYNKYFRDDNLSVRWQYVHDLADEQLDSLQLKPKDQYWRGIVEWNHEFNAHLKLKTRLNGEKRLNQSLAFRPAIQAEWNFGKSSQYLLSFFANTGQRLNKPLAFHLDRLRDNYSVLWQAKPFEKAQKLGLAFSGGFNHERFVKLILDRTWFQDKIITQLDRSNKRLIFRSFPRELRRDALELVLGGKIDPAKKLDAHLMYRWEHWSPDLNMPWQADQAAQLRLRWQVSLSQFDAHYLVRGPQNLVDLSSFPTLDRSPLYHRLDFTYSQRFTHFRRGNHWSKRFTLSLQCINLLGRGGQKGQLETGLLLPDVQEPYWSDPQLRNVQISLRQVF